MGEYKWPVNKELRKVIFGFGLQVDVLAESNCAAASITANWRKRTSAVPKTVSEL
jgi:hypothetical protein